MCRAERLDGPLENKSASMAGEKDRGPTINRLASYYAKTAKWHNVYVPPAPAGSRKTTVAVLITIYPLILAVEAGGCVSICFFLTA